MDFRKIHVAATHVLYMHSYLEKIILVYFDETQNCQANTQTTLFHIERIPTTEVICTNKKGEVRFIK